MAFCKQCSKRLPLYTAKGMKFKHMVQTRKSGGEVSVKELGVVFFLLDALWCNSIFLREERGCCFKGKAGRNEDDEVVTGKTHLGKLPSLGETEGERVGWLLSPRPVTPADFHKSGNRLYEFMCSFLMGFSKFYLYLFLCMKQLRGWCTWYDKYQPFFPLKIKPPPWCCWCVCFHGISSLKHAGGK